MTMTLDQIRAASARQFATERHEASEISESTPSELSPIVLAFSRTLSAGEVQFVPVMDDPRGLYGWCSDGVTDKVKHDGGKCVFGWTIWEWPSILLTAEFHSVWEDATGNLQDITPKPKGEHRIVFVPDRSYPEDFNFDHRPRNRRKRIYAGLDRADEAARLNAQLSGAKRQYEERRAQKAGVSLENWLLSKVPEDPLVELLDRFISACDAFDEHFDSLGAAGEVEVDERFRQLGLRRLTLQRQLKQQLKKLA